jgi:predicted RNA-binding Zn ribbon-like protein
MPVSSPPHDLELVIDFVNTRDVEAGEEELATPADLARWLRGRVALDPAERVDGEQLAQAVALREALRAEMLAHNGVPREPGAVAELERVAERGGLSVRFGADGATVLEARAAGFAGALAALLVPIARADGDGSWERVKACLCDDCHWAFYDRSRNRSGRWCDMAVCGNRTKVRTYRSRRAAR